MSPLSGHDGFDPCRHFGENDRASLPALEILGTVGADAHAGGKDPIFLTAFDDGRWVMHTGFPFAKALEQSLRVAQGMEAIEVLRSVFL